VPGLAPAVAEHKDSVVNVRLVQHNRTNRANSVPRSSGTHSPDVVAVRQVVGDNAAAYRDVKTSGRITFEAQLESTPPGAVVKYKKLIDEDYKDYANPTNITDATLELATWTFKFIKAGCTDQPVKVIDPYQNIHPDVTVYFSNCRRIQ
jgi:hypothetical protein